MLYIRIKDNKMQEEWIAISGFQLYEISNFGRVRSNIIPGKEPRIMKLTTTTRGYKAVRMKPTKNEPYSRSARVHRLVIEHFVPDADMSLYVDHIDENKSNNRLDNLRLCTTQENNEYYNTANNTSGRIPPKVVSINGTKYSSIHNAAKFIFANTDRDVKLETIRREIAAIARGQCKPRNMYGQFLITV
jgi:hypothetical protein